MNPKILKNLPFILFVLFFLFPLLGKNFPLVIIFVLLAFVIYQKNKTFFKDNINQSKAINLDQIKNMQNIKRIVFFSFSALLLLWLFFASIVIIDAGETGVYSLFGKVKDAELRSGFHLVIPLAHVEKMSVRTEEYTMSVVSSEGRKAGDDSIEALTKEGLKINLDITVFYHLVEEKASDVYRELGVDYDEKIIRPTIRTAIRDVVAKYNAKDIYSEKREETNKMIQELMGSELEARGIIVENVLMRNVSLPENLAGAIQEKLQAEQEAQKYDFILDKEKKEKERKVIEAQGQRDAQKIINESLSSNYLYYLYINQLKDRQGTIYVPTSPENGMPLFKDVGR